MATKNKKRSHVSTTVPELVNNKYDYIKIIVDASILKLMSSPRRWCTMETGLTQLAVSTWPQCFWNSHIVQNPERPPVVTICVCLMCVVVTCELPTVYSCNKWLGMVQSVQDKYGRGRTRICKRCTYSTTAVCCISACTLHVHYMYTACSTLHVHCM